MSEPRWSPGKWRVGPINYADVYSSATGDLIALVIKDLPETAANTQLIKSAPDLYEALKDAEGWVNYLRINGCDGGAVVSSLKKIRAALASARGEA